MLAHCTLGNYLIHVAILYDNNALIDYLSRLFLKHKNVDLNRLFC